MTQTEQTLVALLKQVPGFVAYYLLDTGDNIVAALTVFDSKQAAETASDLLSGWFRNAWPAFQLLPPDAGVAELAASGQAERRRDPVARESLERFLMTPRASEVAGRRPRLDRRASTDRRVMGERRRVAVTPAVERRSGTDRRSGVERRSGLERRAGRAGAQVDQLTPPDRIAPPSKRREPFRTT